MARTGGQRLARARVKRPALTALTVLRTVNEHIRAANKRDNGLGDRYPTSGGCEAASINGVNGPGDRCHLPYGEVLQFFPQEHGNIGKRW
jgi:hypothetical protein